MISEQVRSAINTLSNDDVEAAWALLRARCNQLDANMASKVSAGTLVTFPGKRRNTVTGTVTGRDRKAGVVLVTDTFGLRWKVAGHLLTIVPLPAQK